MNTLKEMKHKQKFGPVVNIITSTFICIFAYDMHLLHFSHPKISHTFIKILALMIYHALNVLCISAYNVYSMYIRYFSRF